MANDKTSPSALLIAVQTPDTSNEEAGESLEELGRLVQTLGFRVLHQAAQKLPVASGTTAIGTGKAWELAQYTRPAKAAEETRDLASLVVYDGELRPAQMRHLESIFQTEVLDRTGLIIEIFSRHARTQAAKLQIEIARLNYLAPRLREAGSSGERQAGRGVGESALETERRRIRDRLAELRKELQRLQREDTSHRRPRSEQMNVALVGYTNAGKSSLMRALTGSEVLVEDKLFATLDTTVRALKPETRPRILISDTVGFIKKLPHELVASFHSTLNEARNASLLLYVVDASDKNFRHQLEVVEDVLRQVGIRRTPALLVLNKCDLLDADVRSELIKEFPRALLISTRQPKEVDLLHARIVSFFESLMVEGEIFAPYSAAGLIGEIRKKMRVIKTKSEEGGTRFLVKARPEDLDKLLKPMEPREEF